MAIQISEEDGKFNIHLINAGLRVLLAQNESFDKAQEQATDLLSASLLTVSHLSFSDKTLESLCSKTKH
jgi:hypothetical protein